MAPSMLADNDIKIDIGTVYPVNTLVVELVLFCIPKKGRKKKMIIDPKYANLDDF